MKAHILGEKNTLIKLDVGGENCIALLKRHCELKKNVN